MNTVHRIQDLSCTCNTLILPLVCFALSFSGVYSTNILTTSSANSSIHEGKERTSLRCSACNVFLFQLPTDYFNSSPQVKTTPLRVQYLSALIPIAHISALKLISSTPPPCVARYLMHIRSSALSSTGCNVTGAVCFRPFELSRLLSHSLVCPNKSTEPLWASRNKTALPLQALHVRLNETEKIRMLF